LKSSSTHSKPVTRNPELETRNFYQAGPQSLRLPHLTAASFSL
jgi:hypothetical protein